MCGAHQKHRCQAGRASGNVPTDVQAPQGLAPSQPRPAPMRQPGVHHRSELSHAGDFHLSHHHPDAAAAAQRGSFSNPLQSWWSGSV